MQWTWMLNGATSWLYTAISLLAEWTLLASAFHQKTEIDYRLIFLSLEVYFLLFLFFFQLLSWEKIECMIGIRSMKPLIIQPCVLKRLSLIYEVACWVFSGVYSFDYVLSDLNAAINQYQASPLWVCRAHQDEKFLI